MLNTPLIFTICLGQRAFSPPATCEIRPSTGSGHPESVESSTLLRLDPERGRVVEEHFMDIKNGADELTLIEHLAFRL